MADSGRYGLQQARSVSKVYVAEQNVAALQFARLMHVRNFQQRLVLLTESCHLGMIIMYDLHRFFGLLL